MIAHTLDQKPRVAPALLAEALSRPDSPAIRNLWGHNGPACWPASAPGMTNEIQAGRIREMELALLIQQLIAPIAVHMLMRPTMHQLPSIEPPDLDTVCDTFTGRFGRNRTGIAS